MPKRWGPNNPETTVKKPKTFKKAKAEEVNFFLNFLNPEKQDLLILSKIRRPEVIQRASQQGHGNEKKDHNESSKRKDQTKVLFSSSHRFSNSWERSEGLKSF